MRSERAASRAAGDRARRGDGEGSSRDAVERAIHRFQAGRDREPSFRLLVTTYYRPLLRFFARKGFSPDERLDLTQETFLGIYGNLDGFRHESRFESWLYRLATTTYLKRLRAGATDKRRGRAVPLAEERARDGVPVTSVAAAATADDPLRGMLRDERRRALRSAVRELPPQMRKCLTLRIYQEMTYREIAAVMKIEIDTVKAHLFQARERLRRTVDVAAFEPPERPGEEAGGSDA